MKVLFIYSDLSPDHAGRFNVGLAQLSACLKAAGFRAQLYHYQSADQNPDDLFDRVKTLKPDVLAYSAVTNQMRNIKRIEERLRPLHVYSILGGVHSSLEPEECLKIPGIQAVCRGEGDEALVEFMTALRDGGDLTGIRNFWVKRNGGIHRNDCRPLIEDLDSLPLFDYGIFDYESLPEYAVNRSLVLAASRGCLFNCTYCCNHALRSLYPNGNHYLRYRSPERVVEQILEGLALFPGIERVRFTDDTLSQNRGWFRVFAPLYEKEVGLPYSTNDRCSAINDEVAELYAASGCFSIDMGIESGNEHIRNTIMNRRVSDRQMESAFALLRSRGIRVNAFNVFGMPGETRTSIIDTFKANARYRPYSTYNAFFQPFPGTEALGLCQAKGLPIEKDYPPGFAIRPMVRLDSISEVDLVFAARFFGLLVALYRWIFALKKRFESCAHFEDMLDAVLLGSVLPRSILNGLVPSRTQFKLRYPRAGRVLTGALRRSRLLLKSKKRY